MTDFTSLWEEAGHSAEAEAGQRSLAQAKVASAGIWPFLAMAQDSAEFGQRLDLAGDTLVSAASAHGVEVADLVTSYTREFGLLVEARKTGGKLPDALKQYQFKSADEADEEEGETEQQEAKEGARTAGSTWNAPPARESRPVDDDDHDPDEEGYHPRAEMTARERWGEEGDGEVDPGDAQDRHYPGDYSASRHTAQGDGRPSSHQDGPADSDDADEGEDDEDDEDQDTRTDDEKYRDAGNWYKENTPGDITSSFYDKLSALKTALDEGEDPLAWVAQTDSGQGQPEKPIEHDTDVDYSNSYSEVPPGAPGQSTAGRRHPFA